jgi:hypothetical protein
MAKYFQVMNPLGMSTMKLDSQGRAAVQYTAKNVTGGTVDGRAVLVSVPPTSPLSGVVQKGWVKIDGSVDRHFDKDKEEVFAVKIVVPPNSPAGEYKFRLDVVLVPTPDLGDEGPVVEFSVSAPTPNGGGSKWLLIILVVVLVLVIGGVTTWLLMRKSGKTATTPAPPAQTQPTATPAQPAQDPDACQPGFVWRQAVPADHVCVTPTVRGQTAWDNRLAASRRSPNGGPYGPDTCQQGFVWRDALPNDHVCVTTETRSQAAADNAQAASRKAHP